MLFARIKTELYPLNSPRNGPGKTRSKNAGFESSIPQHGALGSEKIAEAGEVRGLAPNELSFRDLFLPKQRNDQVIGIGSEREFLRMQGSKPIPDLNGIRRLACAGLVKDRSGVSFTERWQH